MQKKLLLLVGVFSFAFSAKSQTTTEDSIKTVINNFFEAMRNADAKALTACFTDSAILQSVHVKDGNTTIANETVKAFADAIAAIKKGDADERIRFDVIKTDGALAVAWTPYEFYYKGNFSHCGADSYQLVRINGNWKIQYLIDTKRKTGCR
ncbi:nuclear transport factor 2 family protein [Panacibacter sp. DH6]|uniref:Nuclear transport factor 2 family protein n=1 Tax=Panacibacter microcysteis TaxID=2793269 RepID=A0A931H0D5_9BACT|nr:nuclear transport factor 2 family protein [Panacibacter microcysteis]MBG9378707.1 nuclear transport factor 2 family protein [Panacibacter microcysteis]